MNRFQLEYYCFLGAEFRYHESTTKNATENYFPTKGLAIAHNVIIAQYMQLQLVGKETFCYNLFESY